MSILLLLIALLCIIVLVGVVYSVFSGPKLKPTQPTIQDRGLTRTEPSADQTTEQPHKLKDNPITKG